MESINFVCLGQTEFVKELGKKGQSSDITTYDNKKDDRIMTYVIPSGFPDKIQPLITAVNLGEYSIVNVDKLDRLSRRTNSSLRSTATRKRIPPSFLRSR